MSHLPARLADQCLSGIFETCRGVVAGAGSRAHLHNSYSLDGVGPAMIGCLVGFVGWYFTSGWLLRNFGDSGWRHTVSNFLPIPLMLATGIFAANLTGNISTEGVTTQAVTQAMVDTGRTISKYTGIGQPSFKHAVTPLPAPPSGTPVPHILPMQQ
jgi:hypothetical protein